MTVQATHGRDRAHTQAGIAVRSGGLCPCLGLVHHEDGPDQGADGADQHEPVTEAQAATGALVDDQIRDAITAAKNVSASSSEVQLKPRNPPGGYCTPPNRTNATMTAAMTAKIGMSVATGESGAPRCRCCRSC